VTTGGSEATIDGLEPVDNSRPGKLSNKADLAGRYPRDALGVDGERHDLRFWYQTDSFRRPEGPHDGGALSRA
jgi:hypothetical protein